MYFNELGLVIDDQGDQVLYHSWKDVHSCYRWIKEGRSYKSYPAVEFTREEIGFIIANYEEEF